MKKLACTFVIVTNLFLFNGCAEERFYSTSTTSAPTAPAGDTYSSVIADERDEDAPSDANGCRVANFTQKIEQGAAKLDVLLAVDTSGSMNAELAVLGQQFSHFFSAIQSEYPDLDYRIAVLLAHANSTHTGTFWQPSAGACSSHYPKVIQGGPGIDYNSEVGAALRCKLEHFVSAAGSEDGGEAGLKTVHAAATTNLSLSKQQGFFRDDASLAVIFAADENDICSAPEGWYERYPDYQEQNTKASAACAGISPRSVFDALLAATTRKQLSIGALANTNLKTGYINSYNKHYSWGYLGGVFSGLPFYDGIVDLAGPKGVAAQISSQSSTVQGDLLKLGEMAGLSLEKLTAFELPLQAARVESVKVDNHDVDYEFQSSTKQVHITKNSAGNDGSSIEVNWCE